MARKSGKNFPVNGSVVWISEQEFPAVSMMLLEINTRLVVISAGFSFGVNVIIFRSNAELVWKSGRTPAGCTNKIHMDGSSGTAGSIREGELMMMSDKLADGPNVRERRGGGRTT